MNVIATPQKRIHLPFKTPSPLHNSTFNFGANSEESLDFAQDLSIPGPSNTIRSAVLEQEVTGNIELTPVPDRVKSIIAQNTPTPNHFLARGPSGKLSS